MPMHNPPHPGEILKELVLDDMSITAAAERLGVSRKTLSTIVNGRASVTAEMAIRLEGAFKKPDAEHWLRLQMAYDLFHARLKLAA